MITAKIKVVLVCAAVLLTAAEAGAVGVPKKIKIALWTNSKTNNDKLMFLARPGEKIKFSIKTSGQGQYRWRVNRSIRKKADGSSFTWTVPAKKGVWNITAGIAGAEGRGEVTWSVTTSAIKTVKPGESIQKAIDSLPAEGGIVELLGGTWELTAPIKIVKRGNITIRGTGIGKTHLRTDRKMVMIQITPFEDNAWVLDETRGGRAVQRLGRDPAMKADYIENITLADFHLKSDGVPVAKPVFQRGGILLAKVSNSRIFNVCMEKTGTGMNMLKCKNVYIRECTWWKSNFGGLILQHTTDSVIENCYFKWGKRWYALDLNGACHRNRIISNTFKGHVCGDMKIYSWSNHNEVIGNVFDGSGSSRGGVTIMNSSWILIRSNVFTNHKSSDAGHWAAVVQRRGGGSHPPEFYLHDNKIINNVFYANRAGDAVKCAAGVPPEVRNNIIVKTRGKPIVGIPLKNCSHNNLWKNADGDTGGGENSISANPLFVDPANGDFRLKSQAGRWNPKLNKWVKDNVTSPCIDAGDPKAKFSNESAPNGGRINMGAYGNTPKASKSTTKGKK